VIREAESKATAEEALAVMVNLWNDWLAAEKDHQKLLRKKGSTPKTDLLLVAGQMMAIKAMISRHLERHGARRKP